MTQSEEMTRTEGTLRRAFFVFTVVLVGASVAGAKSTKLVASWKNPQYTPAKFHRVLVLGMSAKPGVLANFEDTLSYRSWSLKRVSTLCPETRSCYAQKARS